MNGSCGNKRRGCEVNYSLPHDRLIKPFSTEMLRDRNDIQTILSNSSSCPHKELAKFRPLEEAAIESMGTLHLL